MTIKRITVKQQTEWARLKYVMMAHSQQDYQKIRQLFRDNDWNKEKEKSYQATLAHGLATLPTDGSLRNTYQHIWGYFKSHATSLEKVTFQQLIERKPLDQQSLKAFLCQLTEKYQISYLKQSLFLFD